MLLFFSLQFPAELIVDVFSVGRRFIYDLIGAVRKGIDDSLSGASAYGVIVQMEIDSFKATPHRKR